MSIQWYYQLMGQEIGPVPSAELTSLAEKGTIQRDTPIRRSIDTAWHIAHDVKGLFPAAPATPSALSATPTPPPLLPQPGSDDEYMPPADDSLTAGDKLLQVIADRMASEQRQNSAILATLRQQEKHTRKILGHVFTLVLCLIYIPAIASALWILIDAMGILEGNMPPILTLGGVLICIGVVAMVVLLSSRSRGPRE